MQLTFRLISKRWYCRKAVAACAHALKKIDNKTENNALAFAFQAKRNKEDKLKHLSITLSLMLRRYFNQCLFNFNWKFAL